MVLWNWQPLFLTFSSEPDLLRIVVDVIQLQDAVGASVHLKIG